MSYDQDRDTGIEYRQLSARRRKAAKQHTCDFCRGVIPRNTYYYKVVYLADGKLYSQHTHTGNSMCGHDEYEGLEP